VTWSQNTAFFPLRIVEILSRVNFPLLSRLQHDTQAFAKTLEKTIQICATVTLLFVALFMGLGPSLVQIIYGDKWVPALPTFYVFTLAISVGFLSPIINGALDAIGKPRVMMRLGMYWTAINWVAVTVTMHYAKGALAFSLGYCVHIIVGNLAVVFVVKRLIPQAQLWARIRASLAAAVVAAAAGHWAILRWTSGPVTLVAAILAEAAIFACVLALLDRSALREMLAQVRRRPKSASSSA
jgi:O-antigen/teichoic acid export membrane protein